MGFDIECSILPHIMKTKRQTMKKSTSKKCLKKGSDQKRPRKYEPKTKMSKLKSICSKSSINIENAQLPLITKSGSNKSEDQVRTY